MHIAIVRTEFVKARGGAERYAVDLARGWLEEGHRITIVCHRHDEADSRGMNVVTVSRPKLLGPFKHGWFARHAGKAALESGAEAVLCLARAYPGDALRMGDGLHHMQLEARFGVEGARRRAALNPRHSELLKLERELFQDGRFRLYVANSAMIRDEVISRFSVAPERIVVIPNGVDPARFHTGLRERRESFRRAVGIPADATLVLFSGMDFRRKGLDQAARGFAEAAKTDTDMWFACVGPGYTAGARAVLQRAGVLERAVFAGQSSDMAGWYAAADVFVLPSLHDPSANAVTEALACGTPVVTSAQNGAKQHIVEGVNGYILKDRNDAGELAGRITSLIEARPDPREVAAGAGLVSRAENSRRMLDALRRAASL